MRGHFDHTTVKYVESKKQSKLKPFFMAKLGALFCLKVCLPWGHFGPPKYPKISKLNKKWRIAEGGANGPPLAVRVRILMLAKQGFIR